jgi:hypothetical protein
LICQTANGGRAACKVRRSKSMSARPAMERATQS